MERRPLEELDVVDLTVLDALRNFLCYGLHPGSFGEALILQNEARAHSRAHALIRMNDQLFRNMLAVAAWMPSVAVHDERAMITWMQHCGLERAEPNIRAQAKIDWCSQLFGEFPNPGGTLWVNGSRGS